MILNTSPRYIGIPRKETAIRIEFMTAIHIV
jgi:hypothetical protein